MEKGSRDVARRYALALNQIRALLSGYFERFELEGLLTFEEMAKYDRLSELFQRIEFIMGEAYSEISPMIFSILGGSYETSYNLTAYAIESTAAVNAGLTTATAATVAAAVYAPIDKLKLPDRLEKNRKQVVGQIRRTIVNGLAQGSTYRTMVESVKPVLEGDTKKAKATIRTEVHRLVEEAKRESASRADAEGVVMEKTWNTSHDSRVRYTPRDTADHRMLDGKSLPVDADFKGVKGRGPSPGHLNHPAEDINCRCFLTYRVVEIREPDLPKLERMTFSEWEKIKSSALT